MTKDKWKRLWEYTDKSLSLENAVEDDGDGNFLYAIEMRIGEVGKPSEGFCFEVKFERRVNNGLGGTLRFKLSAQEAAKYLDDLRVRMLSKAAAATAAARQSLQEGCLPMMREGDS